MPIRGTGSAPIPSSGGGGAGASETTVPSAGLTISPDRVGVTRQGSRKKYAIHRVTISPNQPSGDQRTNRITVARAAPAMNFQPSGWIGAIIVRSIRVGQKPLSRTAGEGAKGAPLGRSPRAGEGVYRPKDPHPPTASRRVPPSPAMRER